MKRKRRIIRKIEEPNTTVMKAKIVLLILLIIAGFFVSKGMKSTEPEKNDVKTRPPISAISMPNFAVPDIVKMARTISFDSIKKTADSLTNRVLGEATARVEKETSEVSKKAGDAVFETVMQQVATQIDSLPETQQIRLMEQLCRRP